MNALHWLPVKQRIYFKIVLHIYKCLSCTAPTYLCNLINLYNDPATAEDRPSLRSSDDKTKLAEVRTYKKAGDCSFVVGGPKLWNTLPEDVREAESVSTFKQLLKTHLFSWSKFVIFLVCNFHCIVPLLFVRVYTSLRCVYGER